MLSCDKYRISVSISSTRKAKQAVATQIFTDNANRVTPPAYGLIKRTGSPRTHELVHAMLHAFYQAGSYDPDGVNIRGVEGGIAV